MNHCGRLPWPWHSQSQGALCAMSAQPGSVSLNGGGEGLKKTDEKKAGSRWDATLSDGEK